MHNMIASECAASVDCRKNLRKIFSSTHHSCAKNPYFIETFVIRAITRAVLRNACKQKGFVRDVSVRRAPRHAKCAVHTRFVKRDTVFFVLL